jgi:hypothetical protein
MKILIFLLMTLSLSVLSHDEGHGPKVADAPKQGGVVTSVVLAKEANKGSKADLIYKSELARTTEGVVRVYYYDKNMTLLNLKDFFSKAQAELITRKKGKTNVQKFELENMGEHFMGKLPKALRRPYNIDIKVKEGERELLAAFDNLD